MINSYYVKKYLNESGKARLQQILNGVVPNIYTIGIITAENPLRKNLSSEENAERNKKMERYIKDGNWGYIKIIGKYDNIENPFIIYNINRKKLIELAKLYNQEAFIFGLKYENKEERGMQFFYIAQEVKRNELSFEYEGDGIFKEIHTRKFYVRFDDADNYYSTYKGFKFQIPFFDDDIKELERLNGKIKKMSYTKEEMNSSDRLQELYKEYNKVFDDLRFLEKNEDKFTGRSRWVNRGELRLCISEIKNILG